MQLSTVLSTHEQAMHSQIPPFECGIMSALSVESLQARRVCRIAATAAVLSCVLLLAYPLLRHLPCDFTSGAQQRLTSVLLSAGRPKFTEPLHRSNQRSPSMDLSSSFIIGLTTVARPNASYLNDTLHSLLCALDSDNAQPTVLVLSGDLNLVRDTGFVDLWKQKSIRRFTRQGLLLITLGELHPQLQAAKADGGLPQTHGDPPERVWWRSKEALDKAYLMEAAINVSQAEEYYIQFEDDIKLAPRFLTQLQEYINKTRANAPLDIISLYGDSSLTGGVAKAYRVATLHHLVKYLRANFHKSPFDWLLDGFLREYNLTAHIIVPNLVQHVGVQSSLQGKIQNRKSSSFVGSGMC